MQCPWQNLIVKVLNKTSQNSRNLVYHLFLLDNIVTIPFFQFVSPFSITKENTDQYLVEDYHPHMYKTQQASQTKIKHKIGMVKSLSNKKYTCVCNNYYSTILKIKKTLLLYSNSRPVGLSLSSKLLHLLLCKRKKCQLNP